MAAETLTLRELNRATLARQLLLERAHVSVPAAVEKLVGLQAQQAIAPYIGLWTRLHDFTREDLAQLIEKRTIIKATLMRSTLHLFTAADYQRFRATLHQVMLDASEAIRKGRGADIDIEKVVAAARDFLTEKPRTFAEITTLLTSLYPDADPGAMRYTVRTHLPLIQVPVKTGWSYPGKPQFTPADSWLGEALPQQENLRELILRYLAAFGPASVTDMQTWSGLGKLKDAVEKLRPELRVYHEAGGRAELFDLPDAPRPAGDTPAPERFLPEYDNLLLSHSKRTRVIADEHRSKVYLPGLRVRSTILVDGFVRGGWKAEKNKGAATLLIEPFEPLTAANRAALTEEGERLIRFIEPDARSYAVRFDD